MSAPSFFARCQSASSSSIFISFNGLSANSSTLRKRDSKRAVASRKRRFRVHAEVAGIIDHREQQVADLGGALFFGLGPLDLAQFLVDLRARAVGVGPVEADPGRAALDLLGALQGGEGEGDAGDGAFVRLARRARPP